MILYIVATEEWFGGVDKNYLRVFKNEEEAEKYKK